MSLKYLSLVVFVFSLVYSFLFPSFEIAALCLIALIFHAYESYIHLQKDKGLIDQRKDLESIELQLAEIKDDVTKIKMAQSFKR